MYFRPNCALLTENALPLRVTSQYMPTLFQKELLVTQKTMFLCASLLALLLCASAFAVGSTPEVSNTPIPGPSVHIAGCESSGTGEFNCLASVLGGSGSYNYWWQHTGTGQLYQTNSSIANITGCVGGGFTLTVQIMDRVTRLKARSQVYQCSCDEGWIEFESAE